MSRSGLPWGLMSFARRPSPEQRKRSPQAAIDAWTHASRLAARPFPQVKPLIQSSRLPTNCGSRVKRAIAREIYRLLKAHAKTKKKVKNAA